jgi:hypothetical protein
MVLCSSGFSFALAVFILITCTAVGFPLCLLIANHRAFALFLVSGEPSVKTLGPHAAAQARSYRGVPCRTNLPYSSEMVPRPELI